MQDAPAREITQRYIIAKYAIFVSADFKACLIEKLTGSSVSPTITLSAQGRDCSDMGFYVM